MNNKYNDGYQAAHEFKWEALPVEKVFQLVDGYKARALEMDNEFYVGLAQGAQDLVMKRVIPA